ncbi:MAG: hypothetical protein K9L21_04400 [Spirochaetia bacterium]|nr:hypothetical protein [Spirochaetia bacterium]
MDIKVPSRLKMALTLLLVWLAWFVVNLAANGIYYIAADKGQSGLRLAGEVLYFAGVILTGVLIPYHLCRRWGLEIPLFPQKRTVWFWLGSLVFLVLAVFLGIQAMADQGMSVQTFLAQPVMRLIAPLPLFIPTMAAYTILWYGLMLRGWEKVFGGGRLAAMAGIILSAVLYGLYHFASVDEIFFLKGMLDEILITTLIGIGFGIFVVLLRSLAVAFLVNWILNLFVFSPLETFHPPIWQWPLGVIVLLVLWLVYRYCWLEWDHSL